MKKILRILEQRLAKVPRTLILLLAVLVLRNPLMDGRYSVWAWYYKMPLEFLLLLWACLACDAAMRVLGHSDDAADGAPLA
ncbi:MAG TPA: hypothetical protein VK914_05935 [bacterium]|jgi:hypothetical protein|nr:hypothetical protein [bacterium]